MVHTAFRGYQRGRSSLQGVLGLEDDGLEKQTLALLGSSRFVQARSCGLCVDHRRDWPCLGFRPGSRPPASPRSLTWYPSSLVPPVAWPVLLRRASPTRDVSTPRCIIGYHVWSIIAHIRLPSPNRTCPLASESGGLRLGRGGSRPRPLSWVVVGG